MHTDASTTVEPNAGNGFWVRSANEWSRRARKHPVPRSLFGEFWLEGELAILFGDTGEGKSVLAVQIAESIARGRHIGPLRNEAGRRNVVYVDLEMNEKQFEMRYSEDHEGGKAKYLHGHYEFAGGFDRVETDLADAPDEIGAFAAYLVTRLEKIVTEREASVLIIDNITCLKRTFYGARETLPIIKHLKRLKDRLGLSILVVAHSHRRTAPQRIGINDLQGSKLIGRHVDSVFAIAENRLAGRQRYIKQIKQRSGTLLYDASHVPVFTLKKIGGNFLAFEFERFAPEVELLHEERDESEWELIEEIKRHSDAGRSIREIAALIDLPKTTVHRLLKMWTDPDENDDEPIKLGHDRPPDYYNLRPEYSDDDEEDYEEDYDEDYTENTERDSEEENEPAAAAHHDTSPTDNGLKRSLDAYRQEILIEKENERGQPIIWYKRDRKGNNFRYVRKGSTVLREKVEEEPREGLINT